MRIALVVETHVHNDYVSGGLELARVTGAEYLVPAAARVAFPAPRSTTATAPTSTRTSPCTPWPPPATPRTTRRTSCTRRARRWPPSPAARC
ncbi:hypothetical protein ACFQVA_03060 [Actinomadura keratinilytica]